MKITPEQTKKALDQYTSKFDRVTVNLPKGTKDRIKELTGKSSSAYITELVLNALDQLGSSPAANSAPAEIEITGMMVQEKPQEPKNKADMTMEELQAMVMQRRKELGM